MKFYSSCFLFLFICLPVFAQPPYSGTVFLDSGILTADDPSTLVQVIATGVGSRQMFDRRANDGAGVFIAVDALLFNAF
jgi:hypothetical protein